MSTVFPNHHCYLDHAAATPLRGEVVEAMRRAESLFGNPSSPHAAGRAARTALEDAREQILTALGGRSGPNRDRLLFTSGATEANQMAIAGLGIVAHERPPLLHSARDHAGTQAATALQANSGRRVIALPLQGTGQIDQDALGEAAAGLTSGVLSTTVGCSQSGSLEDVAALAARFPTLAIHTDAVQAVGRVPLPFSQLGVASLSLAAHKLGGPRGIGGLLLRAGSPLAPLLPGSQERGLRGGTESVALAVGFATAVEHAVHQQASTSQRLTSLRDQFEAAVVESATSAGVAAVVLGHTTKRLPHLSVIAFPGHDRQAVTMAADMAGLCIASGTACASGSSEPSPALIAAGWPQDVVNSAIRISLGEETTADDLDQALAILGQCVWCRRS